VPVSSSSKIQHLFRNHSSSKKDLAKFGGSQLKSYAIRGTNSEKSMKSFEKETATKPRGKNS
jgi:hypothetical protein